MLYAVFAFIWTFRLLQYTQLKQHSSAPPYSCNFKGPLRKWLTWAWPASVLSMPYQSMSLSLSVCWILSFCLYFSLSLFSDTPNEFKQREKSTAVCQHIHREGRNWHKPLRRARAWENCHDEKRKRQSKRTKINEVDGAAMSYSMPGSKFMPTSLKSIEWCVMFVV